MHKFILYIACYKSPELPRVFQLEINIFNYLNEVFSLEKKLSKNILS